MAQTKSGTLLGWRSGSVSAGPVWRMQVQPSDPATPLLTQPAYARALRSIFVVTWSALVRVQLDADCQPHVAWTLPLGQRTLEGSPSVAGGTVWVALSGSRTNLLAVDAGTGRVRARFRSAESPSRLLPSSAEASTWARCTVSAAAAFPRPTELPRRRYPDTPASGPTAPLAKPRGRVYSTDDGGRHWKRIYPSYAARVVRTSASSGLISVGAPPAACNCATRQLWTSDAGRTWHAATGIGSDFEGRGSCSLVGGGSPEAGRQLASSDRNGAVPVSRDRRRPDRDAATSRAVSPPRRPQAEAAPGDPGFRLVQRHRDAS